MQQIPVISILFEYQDCNHESQEANFLTRQAVNTAWWEIDINGCYSLVKIAFAPICACKNNRRIWRHNASASHNATDNFNLGCETVFVDWFDGIEF